MQQRYFLHVIEQLRRQEEIVLLENIIRASEDEQIAVAEFLRAEYEKESLDYPHTPPAYDPSAALWAAKTIYVAAQLVLYRDHKESDLHSLLPDFEWDMTPSAILSADLCLRFLPDMIFQLKMIDSQDGLIELLEKIADPWHYSAMRCDLLADQLDFDSIAADPCLLQLYANRIIEYKKLKLSEHPVCREAVKSSLGMYGEQFWKEFMLLTAYE